MKNINIIFGHINLSNLGTNKFDNSVADFIYQLVKGEINMSKLSILSEFWDFLKHRKKWWLAPIIFFLVLFGALIVLTEGTAIAPFIYTLF